ncbi:MAG: MFS transporter, partial [Cyanobacteria bacterium P01_D01_bin.44]
MTQLQNNPPPDAVLVPAAGLSSAITKNKAVILAAMCLALFMTNFDGTAGDVALPQIQQELGANISGVQWFLNAYHLPVASLLLANGKFGDVFGRKRIFVLGLIAFTAASALCGFASNLPMLITGRTLQGMGAAALLPLSLTILTATFPDHKVRAKAIGIWSAVSALAMVAGPGLGGLLVDTVGWHSIFWVNVPLGLITLLMTLSSVKKDKTPARQPLDWPGLLLSIASIALLAYTLTHAHDGRWFSSQRLLLLGLTALSFGLFWVFELRSPHPVIPLALLKNRRFIPVCVTQTLVFFMSGGLFFILSLFLQHVQGYSATMTGLCFLPMNGAIIVASFASGWIAARLGWRFPILTGLVIVTVALLSLTRIGISIEYSEILWTLVLAGFGGGLTIPTLAATAMNSVLPIQEGIASALSSISIQLGGILGIAIQGALFS